MELIINDLECKGITPDTATADCNRSFSHLKTYADNITLELTDLQIYALLGCVGVFTHKWKEQIFGEISDDQAAAVHAAALQAGQ